MKEIEDIKDGFLESVKNRLSSPFYGYFIISWLIWNWKIVYTTFFVSGDAIAQRTNLLKIDYVNNLVHESSWTYLVLLPLLSVAFFVWLAPFITCIVYKKVKEDEWKLKKIDEDITQKNIDVKNNTIKKEIELTESGKKLYKSDPTFEWSNEYDEFKKRILFVNFDFIVRSIYDYGGAIIVKDTGFYEGTIVFQIPRDILAYSHTNNLINFDKTKNKIELTEKGKFFVKRYTNK